MGLIRFLLFYSPRSSFPTQLDPGVARFELGVFGEVTQQNRTPYNIWFFYLINIHLKYKFI